MTAKDLFSKTTPFIWAKLLLGLITLGISAVLLAIFMGLGWLFGENGMLLISASGWAQRDLCVSSFCTTSDICSK